MRVAICDDDEGCCTKIEKWLQEYGVAQKVEMNISTYTGANPLLEQLEAGYCFDVIILDIELPERSGIDLGHVIRERLEDETVSIIYISGETKYCRYLFELEPLNYHHKPLREKDIISDMNKALKRCGASQKALSYVEDGITRKILLTDIMYIEARDKQIIVVLRGGKRIFIRDSLTRLAERFSDHSICQCHRSFIVNLNYVDQYLNRCLFMRNGEEIPVGKRYVENVKKAWTQYDLEV